ncbi:hypothetical protein ACJX0J_035077, partial [Zea mays]
AEIKLLYASSVDGFGNFWKQRFTTPINPHTLKNTLLFFFILILTKLEDALFGKLFDNKKNPTCFDMTCLQDTEVMTSLEIISGKHSSGRPNIFAHFFYKI